MQPRVGEAATMARGGNRLMGARACVCVFESFLSFGERRCPGPTTSIPSHFFFVGLLSRLRV